jgi:two-component system OmpR family response regulator
MPRSLNDGSPHVLVVDDNEEILDLLTQLLEDEGYRVSVSRRVLGVDRVKAIDPDVVVQDLMFDGYRQAGWSFVTAARRDPHLARVPIILCTAAVGTVTRADVARQLAQLGVDVVLKPFDLGAMLTTIETAMASRAVAAV